jgi:hypothetical protein
MKLTVLFFVLLLDITRSFAGEPSFRAEIAAVRNRYVILQNRKNMGGSLSAAEEKERQCLLGQLIDQDPVTALTRDIVADIQVLELGSHKAEERALVEKLEELVYITTGFEGRASELGEARSFANTLRKFVVRRDVEGARAWAKAWGKAD